MRISSLFSRFRIADIGNKPQRQQSTVSKRNPHFAYFSYAIPVSAIAAATTLFLTVELTGRIRWNWVAFTSVAASTLYIGVRCLEDTPGTNDSVTYMRRALDEATTLQSELTAQLRVSREVQEALGKKLSGVNATLIASQVESRETRQKVVGLQNYLYELTSQNQVTGQPVQTASSASQPAVVTINSDLLSCDPLTNDSLTEDAWDG